MATTKPHAATTAWKIIPCLPCSSPAATAKFYSENLHFKTSLHDTMVSVFIGDKAAANIYLFEQSAPKNTTKLQPGWCMIAMNERLEEFYEELKEKGKVEILDEIGDKEWGYRQFNVEDLDGNRITYFRFLTDEENEEVKKRERKGKGE